MPTIWSGRRRVLFIELVCLGILQAVIAIIMSLTVTAVLDGASNLAVLLIVMAVGIGGAQWIQRVLAEDLGQDYVQEVRRLLVGSALVPGKKSSLGVTVTRASNDLSAVRNWLALGLVALVTGIPLIIVMVVALFLMDWRTGLAVVVPLAMCVSILPVLAGWTLKRARELRKRRGRMAARIADSAMAAESVRASGAIHRELSAVDRDSEKVADAAVSRAWATGMTRAVMAMGASLSTVAVVVAGHLDAADVAGTMMLLGILAAPVAELGRVVEYRQNYRAATRILIPLLESARTFRDAEAARLAVEPSAAIGVEIGALTAQPGERIHLKGSPQEIRAWVANLIDNGDATINGVALSEIPLRERRILLGVASAHHHLERGTVRRLASLRVPDANNEELLNALHSVGLEVTSSDLKQQLKNGGAPWSPEAVNQLKVSRASLREPALLIIEGIDCVPSNYPGVLIMAGGLEPEAGEWRTVDLSRINV